jgi:hypothetical protein
MILSKRKLGVYRFCLNLDITNLVKIKMIKNIKLEVALLSDINGIVALQELYLVSNLSDKEKNLALSQPVHRTSASCNYRTGGRIIAKDNDRVICLFTGSLDL